MQIDKDKKLYTSDEWTTQKSAFNPTRAQVNRLVMNYLTSTGCLEAAGTFSKESSIDLKVDDKLLIRDKIRQSIINDDIEEVIKLLNEVSPAILSQNQKLLFKLRLQKLVWYIKENKVVEALAYGQEILAPSAKGNPELMKELEKALSLIVFNSVEGSPLAEIASPFYKLIVADEVNEEVARVQKEAGNDIAALVKSLKWIEKKLEKSVSFQHYKFT